MTNILLHVRSETCTVTPKLDLTFATDKYAKYSMHQEQGLQKVFCAVHIENGC